MTPTLSDKRRRIVLFIGEYIRDRKISPNFREVSRGVGYTGSVNAIRQNLRVLRDLGYLTFDDGCGRTLRLLELGEGLMPKSPVKFRSIPILNSAGLRALAARMREQDRPVAYLGGEA